MDKTSLKGSFNYETAELKNRFQKKIKAEGKTVTKALNELIYHYLEANHPLGSDDKPLKTAIMKLKSLYSTDNPNTKAIKREVERLCQLVQL